MGKTFKELTDELSDRQQQLTIWEEVKSHLGDFLTGPGEPNPEKSMVVSSTGASVSEGIIIKVLAEIDSDYVDDLQEEIKRIENTEIGNGGSGKKSRSSRKGSR